MVNRRKFSAEFKAKVVLELLRGEKGLLEASREYKIKDTVLSRWKQEFLERAPDAFRQGEGEGQRQEQERIAELERLVGRLTLELDVAKKVFGYSSSAGKGNE
jgi:transposase-like protein